jgi:hypothetical protein
MPKTLNPRIPVLSSSISTSAQLESEPSFGGSSLANTSRKGICEQNSTIVSNHNRLKTRPVDQHRASNLVSLRRKGFLKKHLLKALCFILHVALISIHGVLFTSTLKHWEHRFTFPLEHQTVVSFWTTVITQGFGTVCTKYILSNLLTKMLPQDLHRDSGVYNPETSNAGQHSIVSDFDRHP